MRYTVLKLTYIILNFICISSNQLNPSNESIPLIDPRPLIIREGNAKDFDKLVALLEKSPDIAQYSELDIQDALFYSYEQKTPFLICQDPYSNLIVGFIATSRSKLHPNTLHIDSLGVDENYRRTGIATKLLHRAYEFGKRNNYTKISVLAATYEAALCYKKFGFEGGSRTLRINLTLHPQN